MTGVFGDHQLGIPYRPIAELFAHYRDRDPGKTAIVDLESGTAISFGALNQVTTDIAAFLRSRGVAKGSRVLLLSDENLEKLLIWFGIGGSAPWCVRSISKSTRRCWRTSPRW